MKYEILAFENSDIIKRYIDNNKNIHIKENLHNNDFFTMATLLKLLLTLIIVFVIFVNISVFTFKIAISYLGIVGFIPWFTGLYLLMDPVVKLIGKNIKKNYLSKLINLFDKFKRSISFKKRKQNKQIDLVLLELINLKEKLLKEKENNIDDKPMIKELPGGIKLY